MKEFLKKYAWTVAAGVGVVTAITVLIFYYSLKNRIAAEDEAGREPLTMFDIPYERYEMVEGEVGRNETMGKILERFGIGARGIYNIEQASKDSFDLRKVQAGRRYVAFVEPDTLGTGRLAHFVYEKSQTGYFVISLFPREGGAGDSVAVRNGEKPVRIERRHAEAEISSSMWMAFVDNGLPLDLFAKLEDIYGWSVDFFGIPKGDSFEVIYDQRYVDTVAVSVGQIWGAIFRHGGKNLYAIPFRQEGKTAYWDENGNSLKKQFLKAPLKFSRITSTFSNSRFHPIHRVYRPHYGVDYAAPSGTPVQSVADGVVTRRYWDTSGGGNTVWIKHARGYETGYLHLRGFAGGLTVGKRVKQGDLIGYVGSTGASTGSHLDYRIRVNGKPINPLSIPQEPGEPIKASDREKFAVVRDKVMGELAGTLPEEERLTRLDSIVIPSTPLAPVNPSPVDTTRNIIDGVR